MMKVATLVLRDFEGPIYGDAIGVDYGAWVLYERKIPMLFACGDFDSVDENQRKILEKNIARLIKLPVHKDVTDFGYVLSLLEEYDLIYVYGALGGRKDHEYVNIRYLKDDSRLIFLDESNRIRLYRPGRYEFRKEKEWDYFSVLPLSEGEITLEGFKYPLNKQKINSQSQFLTSNELIDETAVMVLEHASAMIILSKDTQKHKKNGS